MPVHPTFWWAILIHNVGQTDLVIGVHSGFISRSVHVCAMLANIQTHTQIAFWPAYMNGSSAKNLHQSPSPLSNDCTQQQLLLCT